MRRPQTFSSGVLPRDSDLHFKVGPLITGTFPNRAANRARFGEVRATTCGPLATFGGTVLGSLREAESALAVYVRSFDENAGSREAREQSCSAAQHHLRPAKGGTASALEALATSASVVTTSHAKLASNHAALFLEIVSCWGAGYPALTGEALS